MTLTNTHSCDPNILRAMHELGIVLKTIYLRLQKEGYQLVDGQLVQPNP